MVFGLRKSIGAERRRQRDSAGGEGMESGGGGDGPKDGSLVPCPHPRCVGLVRSTADVCRHCKGILKYPSSSPHEEVSFSTLFSTKTF